MSTAQKQILSDIDSTLAALDIGAMIAETLHEIEVGESLISALADFEN